LSRAFGDFDLKNKHGVLPENQPVCVVPDIYVVENICSDDMIFLFCDGLYEHATNRGIIECLQKHLQRLPEDPAQALCDMLDELVKYSEDNMSCILIQFKDGSEYSKYCAAGEKEYKPMPPANMSKNGSQKSTDLFVKAYKDFEKRYHVSSQFVGDNDLYTFLKSR